MGTRADFYLRKEKQMQWLGSIAHDGYPEGIDETVLKATTDKNFIEELQSFFKKRSDVTFPEMGWPWPWFDSLTTDYSYVFEKGKVMASCHGYGLFDPLEIPTDEERQMPGKKMQNYFPDMRDKQNVRWDKGSGIIIIGV